MRVGAHVRRDEDTDGGKMCEDTGWWRPWISQGERPPRKPAVTSSSLHSLSNCCGVSQPAVGLCSGCPGKPRWRVLVETRMCLQGCLESHPDAPGWASCDRLDPVCAERAIQGPVSPSFSGRSVWERPTHSWWMEANAGLGPVALVVFLCARFMGWSQGERRNVPEMKPCCLPPPGPWIPKVCFLEPHLLTGAHLWSLLLIFGT